MFKFWRIYWQEKRSRAMFEYNLAEKRRQELIKMQEAWRTSKPKIIQIVSHGDDLIFLMSDGNVARRRPDGKTFRLDQGGWVAK